MTEGENVGSNVDRETSVKPPRVRQSRTIVRVGLVMMVVVLVIWGLLQRHHSPSGAPASPTVNQLLSAELTLNSAYATGNSRVTYSFFDPPTRLDISYANYATDRASCPPPGGASTVEGAVALRGGWWAVSYRDSGVTLVDYWRAIDGHWQFSLLRSNPRDAALYQLTPSAYAGATGCTG